MSLTSRHKLLRSALSIVVLALFASYILNNSEKFAPLLKLNPFLLIIIALLFTVAVAINGVFTQLITQPFNVRIPLRESIFLAIISSVGNFFAPAGTGYGFRALYLKKKYNLSYIHYTATLAGYYILLILVTSLLGLVAMLTLERTADANYDIVLITLVSTFLFALSFSVIKIGNRSLPQYKNQIWQKILHTLIKVAEGWKRISADRSLMLRLVALTLVSLAISMTMTGLIIASLHLSASFAAIVLFSVLGSLSQFINITPGNIGVKEGIYLFSAGVLGFKVEQIILIAVVERGIVFITLLCLWLFSESMKKKLI